MGSVRWKWTIDKGKHTHTHNNTIVVMMCKKNEKITAMCSVAPFKVNIFWIYPDQDLGLTE